MKKILFCVFLCVISLSLIVSAECDNPVFDESKTVHNDEPRDEVINRGQDVLNRIISHTNTGELPITWNVEYEKISGTEINGVPVSQTEPVVVPLMTMIPGNSTMAFVVVKMWTLTKVEVYDRWEKYCTNCMQRHIITSDTPHTRYYHKDWATSAFFEVL